MEHKKMNCCFTGYRPYKFPFSLDDTNSPVYREFYEKLLKTVSRIIEENDETCFYSGMAEGFDIIAAEAVIECKERFKDKIVMLYCTVPFKKQAYRFSSLWQGRYDEVLSKCDRAILLSEGYFSSCFSKRNRYMVNHSSIVITWYDGKSGGTKNTLDYAMKKGKKIINTAK